MWFDRHSMEMDALRESHGVRAAELSVQLAQLQVRLPIICLIWAASHVQCKEAWQLWHLHSQESSSNMPIPEIQCESHPVLLCCSTVLLL